MDNFDYAVYMKLNDLAERFGLKPYDFVATFGVEKIADEHGDKQRYVLEFEIPAGGNALREERFDKMLKALGIVVRASARLIGTPGDIYGAIEHALSLAPRQRFHD